MEEIKPHQQIGLGDFNLATDICEIEGDIADLLLIDLNTELDADINIEILQTIKQ